MFFRFSVMAPTTKPMQPTMTKVKGAGEQVKQTHTDAAGDHAGALTEKNGRDEEGDVAQVDQAAVGGERQANVHDRREDIHQDQANGRDGKGLDAG